MRLPKMFRHILFVQGRLNKSDGYFYEGGWLHGKKHGQGLVIYPNGDCFEGYWRKDLRDGEGKYWVKRSVNDNESSQEDKEGLGKLITGVWKRGTMKTGIINGDEKLDVETDPPSAINSC